MIEETHEHIPALPSLERRTALERLAERLGASASARAVFAEPVARDGVTVIPVAKVRYGFGGGGGRDANREGEGGGGGMEATPLGYIELKDGHSTFRPIRDPASVVRMVFVSGLVSALILRPLLRRRGRS